MFPTNTGPLLRPRCSVPRSVCRRSTQPARRPPSSPSLPRPLRRHPPLLAFLTPASAAFLPRASFPRACGLTLKVAAAAAASWARREGRGGSSCGRGDEPRPPAGRFMARYPAAEPTSPLHGASMGPDPRPRPATSAAPQARFPPPPPRIPPPPPAWSASTLSSAPSPAADGEVGQDSSLGFLFLA
jgi:hypothetical protein